ncbi:MAG: hypothetical protein KGL39_30175 [Patescibacteria group bacterium]|nr:hypothetical protein [Patescibacteria group bacterium]
MAEAAPTGYAAGAYNSVKQSLSIFSDFNKVSGDGDGQGQPDVIAAYRSEMPDEEIIALKSQWKRDYAQYYANTIKEVQEKNYDYWLGKQTKDTVEDMLSASRPLIDNEIFVNFETFLPLATRANPDPVVTIDQSMGDQTLADLVRNSLKYQADRQKLHMLLRGQTRDWGICKIGVLKLRWDTVKNDIATEIVNPKRMIFDRDGYVDVGGNFTGDYLGEQKMIQAGDLIKLFPKSESAILSKAGGKKGTKLQIEEWWYKKRDYFFTLDDHVLGKFKNHLWNYDGKDPLTGDQVTGSNHLEEPCDPYIFLVVYTTRTQPHDDTTPVEQSITVQDLINRRFRQIDKNAESTNNGIVVNGNLNSEQAALAAEAVRKGGAIRIPDKAVDVRTAVMRLPAPPLAATVAENIQDARQVMANVFGVSGSTPQNIENEDTVRGKILSSQMDTSRIGGSVTECLEQVADTWFNKVLQIMYVYYDVPHFAAAIGEYGAQELIQLKNTDLRGKILVTVKEGSMVPKDPLTLRNQAIDLWSAQGIDPISLGKYLEMPDPYEYAKNLLMWQLIQKGALPPQMLFPDFQQPAAPAAAPAAPGQQPGVGGPAVNPLQGPQIQTPTPPASNEAVQAQGQQLLGSVPL